MDMTNTSASAIESLRTFALANNEIAFAHLCTAALAGEEWAGSRIDWALRVQAERARCNVDEDALIRVIRATDTTRPDGAIARSFTP